ncbi:MAG: LysE family transporter [Bacteroidota bacterium]|nr:LysE family transporter [Bacteroidota bacterium]
MIITTMFLKGLIIGFAMAIPVGPIGVLCIRKTLNEGRLSGFIIGLGGASADLLFSCIAAFGLTIISDLIAREILWLRLLGGGLLLFLGIKTFFAKPKETKNANNKNLGFLASYLSTVLLTLTNPTTVFAFIAVFAALGLGHGLSVYSASFLVIGVLVGSCLWFFLLSNFSMIFRKRLNNGGLQWVNRIAGILILVSGAIALSGLF